MKNTNKLLVLCMFLVFLLAPAAVMAAKDTVDLMPVWNQRVDPLKHPLASRKKTSPVNWNDFKDHISMAPHAYTGKKKKEDKHYDMILESLPSVDLNLRYQGFKDRIYMVHSTFAYADNYKDVVDWWADNDITFAAAGIGSWTVDGWFSNPWPGLGDGVPADVQEYVLKKMGRNFLGWIFTEEDDRYNIVTAWYMPETPVSRKDGYRNFMALCDQVSKRNGYYMVTLCNTVWGNYTAEMNATRAFGNQQPSHFHNVQLMQTMMRGGSRQTGILWYPNFVTCNGPLGQSRNFDHKHLQTAGLSMSLSRKAYFLNYLYGAALIHVAEGIQVGPYDNKVQFEGHELVVGNPSPFAEIQLEITNFMKTHPDIGKFYAPVAMIWDFYAGWQPPRKHGANYKPFTVWGSMPYEKGDHQIDMFYRMLFPGCSDATFNLNEKGYLTSTPCGDIADVLFSNVSRYVLNQYNAAVVIGPTKIEGQLADTLKDFIEQGGSVATTAAQLTRESAQMFGVSISDEVLENEHYVQLLDGGEKPGNAQTRDLIEQKYNLHKIVPGMDTEILASNYDGVPVVTLKKTAAGGELLVFAADYGLSNWTGPKQLKFPQYDTPAQAPYKRLRHFDAIMKPWLRKFNLVEVNGPAVHYLTNVTDRPDRFVVSFFNNENDLWKGKFSIKNAKIASAKDWISGKSFAPGKSVELSLKPNEFAIVEVITDKPAVSFKTRKELPELNARENRSIADETIADLRAYSAQAMADSQLENYPRQSKEKAGSLYVNAWLFDGIDPEKWVPEIKNLGFAGVEVKGTDFYRPEMRKLWDVLKKHGLRVGSVHAGVNMQPFNFGTISACDERFRQPVLKWLEKTMDVMKASGIDRLVVYTGYKREHRYLDPIGLRHDGSMYLDSLKRLAKKAKSTGIKIIVEGCQHQQLRQAHELRALIDEVNSPYIVAGMDVGSNEQFRANYINELKVEYTLRNIGFAIPIEPVYMKVGDDWRSDIWRLRDIDIDEVYDDSVMATAPKGAIADYALLSKSNNLDYMHISNLSKYSNGHYQNDHTSLSKGIIDVDVYKQILSDWKQTGKASCLYLLNPDDPMKALKESVDLLKKIGFKN